MKKIIIILIALVAVLYADAPTSTIYVANSGEWDIDTVISSGAFDTLAAADSTTILSKRKLEVGYEYALVHGAFTGTGSDSVSLQVRADLYNYRNDASVFASIPIDSLTSSVAEMIIVPIGSTIFGRKLTIKFLGYGDDGGQLIISNLALYKRRTR